MGKRIRLRRAAQERRTHMQEDLEDTPLNPRRWRYILNLLLSRHNWRHSNKDKGVSFKTMAERGRFLHSLFRWLRTNEETQFRLDPRSLSGRHIDFIMVHWQEAAKAGRMSPATIQTYFSFLSTFLGWIGKPQLVKPIRCYFDDPKLYRRSYVAKSDKSWTAAGISVVDHISAATHLDRHVAAALMLMAAFGLRFKEACMVRPHRDVVERAAADRVVTPRLDTHRGTKGGRERSVPITSDTQRQAIEFAKAVAVKQDDSVSDPHLTLKQALRRARYVMERLGITKRDLGVVPHGLRHQYAAERYQELAGTAPPVAGGGEVEKAVDENARQIVAAELGHGRRQITNVYLGKAGASNGEAPIEVAPKGPC